MKLNEIYLGDCYDLIKQIPDKSIDLIYTDIQYLMKNGGMAKSSLGERIRKKTDSLENINITNGIDYLIFNEFIRILKHIYIIYGAVKNK